MSTDGRKVFVLVAATVAILALAAVMVFAAVTNLGSQAQGSEQQGGKEEGGGPVGDVAKLGKVTKNKGKSDPGMCVYSATNNRYTFKNVPKGNLDENDPVTKEIDKGGQFADSQADCDKLNALVANPPKDSEPKKDGQSESVTDNGPQVDPPPEALKLETRKTGEPKAKR